MSFDSRIEAYKDSIKEADRYTKKAKDAIKQLEKEGYGKNNASAKRASMDLSNALVEVRRVS
ncbi:MAG: hypothetical protein KAJ03_07740 [Gammaproteobacteria bacterium]|nr:hypothetical protein [Gammaproteobacteria bacterium]